jgi:PKD repeat protein
MSSTSYGLYGTYVGINFDKDGNTRCKDFPNMGAYETNLGKTKPVVKFFITSNIYPGSPSFVYQTAKFGEPKTHAWYLNGVYVSDSVVLKTTQFVSGSNTLKLITHFCGGSDSFQMTFNVNSPTAVPGTDFVANKNYISGGDVVTFLDQSTNGPTAWSWQISPDSIIMSGAKVPAYTYVFGNNFSQNPQIKFIGSGKYNVCLTATNSIGKGSKLCKTSYISVIPGVALGSVSVVTDAQGFLYDDGGRDANYLGGKLTPTIVIAPCADSVYLTFSMFDMSCGNAFLQLYEGKTTTGKRIDVCGGTGLSSGFTGGVSSGTACATVCMPNVNKPDTFKAKSAMTIQMNDGTTALGAGFAAYWWSKPLSGAKKVKAQFTVSGSGDSVCTNGQTNFVNTSVVSPGDIVSYLWDLDGDATTFECVGSCATAFWPYFLPGPVNVTLIATSCGGVDTFSKTLTIYNPTAPKAKVLADNTTPAIGDVVFFSAPIPVCVETYQWTITKSGTGSGFAKFVNGTHDYSSNPQVIFTDTGYYDVKLYVDNLSGQQKDSITVKSYIHVRSPYCVPTVALLNQGMGISKFTFNTLSNTMTQAAHEYTNYTTDQSLTTTVAQGVKYPVSISRNPTLNFDALNRSVFIDWNQDGSFTGANEEAAEDSNSTSNIWNGSITVPRNAKIGATTMRVAVNKGSLSNKPCGQNEFGEYQDYRIYVVKFNIPPVITLKGTQGFKDTIKMEQGKGNNFIEPGYSASSYLYGNMTGAVKRSSRRLGSTNPADSFNIILPNLYLFTYSLTDSAGNVAVPQYRLVKVTKDLTPPTLFIDQPDTLIMEVTKTALTPFPAQKVISADDLVDGPLKASVVNDASNVYSNILGLYMITYSVTDLSGNTSTAYRYVKIIDTIKPTIILNGSTPVNLEVNTNFIDPGVKTADNYYTAGVLDLRVKTRSNLDIGKLGTYTIIYDLSDPSGNVADSVVRTIIVIDTLKPVISLNGPATDSIAVETIYKDPGVLVTDNYNKTSDLSVTVTGTFYTNFPAGSKAGVIGYYDIIYTVTDKAGNKSSVTRTILVKDWIAPVITLNGSTSASVCRWSNYSDAGYTLSDNYDLNKDITVKSVGTIITQGTTIEDLLTLQYIATDKSGNIGYSQVRYIQVKSIHDWPCSNSGIEPGLSLDKYISVYPNPNSGKFMIRVDFPSQEKVRMSISNLLGQEIAAIHDGVVSKDSYTIDLSSAPAGMYMLNIVSDNQTITKKIIIDK